MNARNSLWAPPRLDGPSVVRTLALLTLAVGAGVWGALLFAPVPSNPPPTLEASIMTSQDTRAVARWFGGGALRVRVAVMGLIAADDGRGAALLAVNGGAPQAYRTGQVLAPGVTLAAVAADAVSIDQDGVIERVAVPSRPGGLVQGFVPVMPAKP
jgi:general secretion pathway protein C